MTVCLTLDADHDLLALHNADPARYPYFLESVAHGATTRYDILFAFPQATLALTHPNTLHATAFTPDGADFLNNLDIWWRQQRVPQNSLPHLPFSGGWFVYLGYELAAQIEPRLRLPAWRDTLPIACAVRVPAALIKDHRTHQTLLIAEREHETLLQTMQVDLKNLPPLAPDPDGSLLSDVLQEDNPQRFLHDVQRILRYIRDGDVFQVNLSRAWRGHLRPGVTPTHIYQRLRRHNPAPFAGLARHGDAAVISSSPERLVKVRDGVIETRPIAGTRPRVAGGDSADKRALLAHPKERAEHVMLIDLERNDLGRVCAPGSVAVDELMVVESYAHVHHIVSNVRGRLRADVTPGQVLRAVFPGGTITGCPKVRCMEIIAELEQSARGPYTGAMGYINRDGGMDFNILIRTLLQNGADISLRAGAGIVADSIPERELEETRAKARGLLLALE
ncbi:MAG: aminodeoxychorismate synthase component I [Pseudomonadota bacterium]